MQLDKVVANLIQKVEQRFYGKHRGFVVENDDPEQLGRLRLKVPSVLGNEVVTGWAMPCLPYGGSANLGTLFIPEIDAGIWVEFEEGDLEFPIWVGTFWSKPGGESELPKPNDDTGAEEGSVQSPPTRKIFKTVKGHTIQLEDADGGEMVLIVEAKNGQVITMNQDGIKITDGKNGNTVTLDNSGIILEDKNSNIITMDSSSITLKSSRIKIGEGASAEKLVLGTTLDQLLTQWFSLVATHTHVGNLGAPTTPPIPPLVPPVLASALSPTHLVE